MVAIDAVANAMAAVSRATAPDPGRGGLANLWFVRASAERPPHELRGRADRVIVNFPWGSLARGLVGLDDAALAGVAALLRPGGRLEVLASVAGRDQARLGVGPEALADAAAIGVAWACHGLHLDVHRPATPAEVASSGSSWARRLRQDPGRRVVRLAGSRPGGGPSPRGAFSAAGRPVP